VLKNAYAGLGRSHNDLNVRSMQRDPYRRDADPGYRNGRWFAEQENRFVRPAKTIHLRGRHYADASVKPEGTPYCNHDKDWRWLHEAAQDARRLGHLSITDAKIAEPIARPFAGSPTEPFIRVDASGANSVSVLRGWPDASCAGKGGRHVRAWLTEKHKRGRPVAIEPVADRRREHEARGNARTV
jgi:hypothetical protein